MNIVRLMIDRVYYWNKIYCECVCHDDFYHEMQGRPCHGCQEHVCEWVGKILTPPKTVVVRYDKVVFRWEARSFTHERLIPPERLSSV